MAVDLQIGVPRRSEQLVDTVAERLRRRRRGREVPQLLLTDHDVAVGARGGAEDTMAGHVRHALAVVAVTGFLGHLEAEHRPRAQRSNEPGAGTGRTGPGNLGTVGTVRRGLLSPRQGDRRADDAFQRPLDMLAERLRAGVHEDDTLGRPSLHEAPPSTRLVSSSPTDHRFGDALCSATTAAGLPQTVCTMNTPPRQCGWCGCDTWGRWARVARLCAGQRP